MRRFNLNESIKIVIIAVLFILTILLLYLNWNAKGREFNIKSIFFIKEESIEAESAEDAIVPQYIAVSDGSGAFRCVIEDEKKLLKKSYEITAQILNAQNISIGAVENENYLIYVKEFKSIIFSFPYEIPAGDFCSWIGTKLPANTPEEFTGIKAVIYSAGTRESSVIIETGEGKYYLIESDSEVNRFDRLGDFILSDNSYYCASDIFGSGSKALIPIAATACFEISDSDDEIVIDGETLAKNIFGSVFDFVRRIGDSFGNTTYMYGYGQRTLKVSSSGISEYSDEAGKDVSSFYDDINVALQFIRKAIRETEWYEEDFILTDATTEGDKILSHTFIFDPVYTGITEYYSDKNGAITITVTGGKVSFARINLKTPAYASKTENYSIEDPANTIASECAGIYEKLNGAKTSNTEYALEYVTDNLKSVHLCVADFDGKWQPAWKINVGGEVFCYKALI